MAKNCSICGKKFGLLEGKISIADGLVCTSCWGSAGMDLSPKSLQSATNKRTNQLRDLIEINILRNEADRAGLRGGKKTAPAKPTKETAPKAPTKEVTGPKPIDIGIQVAKNRGVGFYCEGTPVINFHDLIHGNEMIIGDGFIKNESNMTLPEVRIACEFDPPIVDPGLIYYKEGTFVAGMNKRFEIDDPPVNLEEYAKIKRTRKGKITFTLYLGEQKLATEVCPMQIQPAPEAEMKELMEAIIYKEEKNAAGPVNIFLYAKDQGHFDIDLMRKPELLYSMYSNGKEQLIGDVYVSNDTEEELRDIRFQARFTSDILAPIDLYLGNVPAGERVAFEVDDPAIDVAKLEVLTEIETCTATYKLTVGGKEVAEATGRITICPYDQWNASLLLLPAYMTPNHPNVITVLQNASKWMLVNGMNPSLEGYQSNGKRVEEMVEAVYNSVKEANIVYSNPPASFFGPQRIRLCETIFEQKFATCLDITILFASCLESFGLNPVLITAPGHIFAGVWLHERGRLKEPVLSDAKLIQQYIKEGHLVAVECTAMNLGNDLSYKEAKAIANRTIAGLAKDQNASHECIDVQIARAIGVRPLPIRKHNGAQSQAPVAQPAPVVEPVPAPAPQPAPQPVVEPTPAPELEPAPVAEPVPAPAEASSAPTTYDIAEYKAFAEDLSHISIDNFYEKQSKRVIKDAIAEIVEVEGPISQPALIRTLIQTTSLGRASKQITEHLDKLVATADVKITRQAGVRFLWSHGTDPATFVTYRQREQRSPEDVCKYELKNAVCYLIQENGPMSKEEITKAMVSMFGYSRSSKKLEDGAAGAIKAARELKAIEQRDDKKFVLI